MRGEPGYIALEENTAFSKSLLWQFQRSYFKSKGINAWRDGDVPHYITNNPMIANAYAEIIFGFFRDKQRLFSQYNERIYLLEMGGGLGRLAYHVLKHLKLLCDTASFTPPAFTYILSDFTDEVIEFWKTHSKLKPFEDAGMLDYARFDATKDDHIALQRAGITLSKNSLKLPLLLIGNYFFDSVPQSLFKIREKKLYEINASVFVNKAHSGLSEAALLKYTNVTYNQAKTTAKDRYPEQGLNSLLEFYQDNLKNTHLLFPDTAIRCLERLKQISDAGFLLLSADKGSNRLEDIEDKAAPTIVKHGSFSLSVNFHAIKSYFENQGAIALFTNHPYSSINICFLQASPFSNKLMEASQAYYKFVERFGPDDFFMLKNNLEQNISKMDLLQLQAYVRFTGYDGYLLKRYIPQLFALVKNIREIELPAMRSLLYKVWDMYYPIGEDQDLAFDIGHLFYEMSLYNDALVFFNLSLQHYAPEAPVYYNMAACCFLLGDDEAASGFIAKTLEMEPNHEGAREIDKELKNLKPYPV
jgi:hypothetical protein